MPLEFIFSSRTNRSYGGGPTSTLCNILEAEKVGFGSAIEAIFVEFLHPGRVSEERVAASQKKSGWESFLGFQELDPLHGDYSVRFERKRKRLVIKYTSKTISADDAFHTDELITRDLFFRGFDETIEAINWGLKKRLKADDDFDIPQFLKWLNVMRSVEYASDEALVKAWVHASKYVDAKYAARNAWDQLDLDWDTFHRDARFLLDDADDWSNTDDFAPHGNDTGADIFAEWADYERVEISEAARIFGIPHTTMTSRTIFGKPGSSFTSPFLSVTSR